MPSTTQSTRNKQDAEALHADNMSAKFSCENTINDRECYLDTGLKAPKDRDEKRQSGKSQRRKTNVMGSDRFGKKGLRSMDDEYGPALELVFWSLAMNKDKFRLGQ
ncbi:unnamed protein product [Gongylonema pulchrum]|uniref:Uncharacterized protein n=1 Tax=Gongylonema pulchrum TaxID=637853 RepID=A0A183DEL6_9BILA|nr:unnamed protein product [Gongylonema pulchrum]